MAYSELNNIFERIRDHAWQTYASTINERLPAETMVSAIVARDYALYDLVYFFGSPKDTAILVDKLLQKYSDAHPQKHVIRMNAQDINTILFYNIKYSTRMPVLTETEFDRCDLFVLEYLDTVAGYPLTEELLYGVLDQFLEHHVQIVVTGNVRLADMRKLAPRIRAKIDGGISCLVR